MIKFIRKLLSKKILTPVQEKIRFKIIALVLIVTFIPLIIVTYISNRNIFDDIQQSIIEQNVIKMNQAADRFNDNIERIDESLTAFYFDSNFQFYIDKLNSNSSLQYSGLNFLQNKMSNYLMANYFDFEKVHLYLFEEKRLFSTSMEKDYNSIFINDYYINKTFINKANSLFYLKNIPSELDKVFNPKAFYITKIYRRFEDREKMSILIIQLKDKLFNQIRELLDLESGNKIYLINSDGYIINNSEVQNLKKGYGLELKNEISNLDSDNVYFEFNEEYVFYEKLENNLLLVKTIPLDYGSRLYYETLFSQLSIILLIALITIIAIIILSKYITKPILELTKSMRDMDSILDEDKEFRSQVKTKDEIKVLENNYAEMIKRLKKLIDEKYKQKIKAQKAQLMALQAQINPHFMYNTLQMIGAMAVEDGSMDTYKMITNFSNTMRYNMKLDQDLVKIDEEIANLKNYLKIQEMRFDSLEICYDLDKDILDKSIPKFTIQPVVENAFKYAFINNKRIWQIKIMIYQEDYLYIKIQDNGIGIKEDKLKEINSYIKNFNEDEFLDSENIGLKNINSRLKLFFGRKAGLEVKSKTGSGTEIVIKIPNNNEE